MAENTKIEWATHTLNWWTGCESISTACLHCYAHSWAKRAGRVFEERRLTTEANRRLPLKWQRDVSAFELLHGHRQRIFVNSLSDWADNKVPQEWRESLFALIRQTPELDYLLLTKRIGNAKRMLPPDWGDGYPNVWLGSTIANQEEADRDIIKLLTTPARIHFLSCEPILGAVDLTRLKVGKIDWASGTKGDLTFNGLRGSTSLKLAGLDWVISGGESGPGSRPANVDWFRVLRDQCQAAGVAFLFKQWGDWIDHDQSGVDMLGTERSRLYEWPTSGTSVRLGKKECGRLLDGRTWDQSPITASIK